MPSSNADLERQLKIVTKTGKYVVGRKEVERGLKGTKLLVWSASAGVPPQILAESRNLSIPSIRFDGNPIELGKACGIPYKVSVFAIKSGGEAVLSQYESSKDYSSDGNATIPAMETTETKEDVALQSGLEKERKRKKKETATTREPSDETDPDKAKKKTKKSSDAEASEKKGRKKNAAATKSKSETGKRRKKTNDAESNKQPRDNDEESED